MTLGKRKERGEGGDEEEPEPQEQSEFHGSTLFVSNLPYNATSTDLQTLLSEIAPIRNAFVVTEHGTGVSKGVGYVSFSIREDAQLAYDKIAKEGISLVGRKLRVQWAEQKSKVKKEKTDDKKEQPVQQKPRPSHSKTDKSSHDPLSIRTIVISGLPTTIDSKTLWKKIRKYEGAEKVELSVDKDGEAHAVFSTPSTAQDAVNKLHAHVFKGNLLSVTLKKRLDSLASHKQSTSTTSTTTTTAAAATTPSHGNRLIVRNLPFTATESDLRSIFLPHGPIYTINMPLKERKDLSTANDSGAISESTKNAEEEEVDDDKQNIATEEKLKNNKGFAFVWYYSKKDAERAMEKCNGILVRAGAAEELVKGKQKRKKERRLEKKLAILRERKESGGDAKEEREEENDEVMENSKADKNERIIAVDWALSKDRWEEEKAKIEEELNKTESEEEVAGSDSDSGDEGEDGLGVHEDEESDSDSNTSDEDEGEDDDRRDEDDKPIKPELPQTDIGTTLFIRNVPYDATEDELRTLFRSFGPLRYARITMDPTTGRSRGTGFACFWNKEDADKVVQQSELLRAETTGGSTVAVPKKKNPFTLPSILTPDPSSSLAQNLVLHSRALDVVRAVTRDEAGRLKDEGERAREKADKRNMYLLREGVILPNSPHASSLSQADLERRTRSYNARKALLKSNPSLYISKTRLSVRQIPVYVTDLMLKRLSMHAARVFEKEVKEEKRPGLSTGELEDPGGRPGQPQEEAQHVEEAQDLNEMESEAGGTSTGTTLNKKAKRKVKLMKKLGQRGGIGGVRQAKIVRQAERADPITGKGKSRGYGFVEMYTHADALRVLRWANNNPDVPVLLKGWWREELERMIKVERDKLKGKEDKADDDGKEEARLKRMMNELEKEKQREEKRTAKSDGELEGKRDNRGTLIVEFSIENIQVVQRRNATQRNKVMRKPENDGKSMLDDGQKRAQAGTVTSDAESSFRPSKLKGSKRKRENDKDGDEHRPKERKQQPQKKRRLSVDSSAKVESTQVTEQPNEEGKEPSTPGQKLGSIIGRKRRERRGKNGKTKA